MYNGFYGFKESPFNLTPNSKFFFASNKHREALDSLVYAIDQRKGFVVITGEIGSGKTTVCRTLLSRLDRHTQVALITNTHLNSKDLLTMVLEDLEIEHSCGTKAKLLSVLNDYLIGQIQRDNNVVLIIDEAQNLKPAVLEEIRMLSNLETETEKLIQIILLGQPELKQKLALSRLEQLRQRVAVYFHLSALNEVETKEYILHRLKIASGTDHKYMTDEALQLVYQFAKGIPRLINQICDSAFLTGFINETPVIDANILKEVMGEAPIQQFGMEKTKEYV
jgi:general secretion pathway protein A